MFDAAIFDMDGLLIDSEPLWEEAEIRLLGEVGVPLTRQMTNQTMGWRLEDVVAHWHRHHPWEDPPPAVIVERINDEVARLVSERGAPRPGVPAVVERLAAAGLRLGLASSSSSRLIEAVVARLGLADLLTARHSAEHEPYGKPHPGVFLTAADRLGVPPERCLVFEDSPNGVLAAKAARMTCVAVPDEKVRGHRGFCIADVTLDSLADFEPAVVGLELDDRD